MALLFLLTFGTAGRMKLLVHVINLGYTALQNLLCYDSMIVVYFKCSTIQHNNEQH